MFKERMKFVLKSISLSFISKIATFIFMRVPMLFILPTSYFYGVVGKIDEIDEVNKIELNWSSDFLKER